MTNFIHVAYLEDVLLWPALAIDRLRGQLREDLHALRHLTKETPPAVKVLDARRAARALGRHVESSAAPWGGPGDLFGLPHAHGASCGMREPRGDFDGRPAGAKDARQGRGVWRRPAIERIARDDITRTDEL